MHGLDQVRFQFSKMYAMSICKVRLLLTKITHPLAVEYCIKIWTVHTQTRQRQAEYRWKGRLDSVACSPIEPLGRRFVKCWRNGAACAPQEGATVAVVDGVLVFPHTFTIQAHLKIYNYRVAVLLKTNLNIFRSRNRLITKQPLNFSHFTSLYSYLTMTYQGHMST